MSYDIILRVINVISYRYQGISVLSHLFACDVQMIIVLYCFYSHNLHSCSIKNAWFEYVIIETQLQYYFDVIILVLGKTDNSELWTFS